MTRDDRGATEATLSARLHAVLGGGPDATQLEALYREAGAGLGREHPLSLLIEYHLNYVLGPARPVDDLLTVWSDLRERARVHLPECHPTLMAIRACYARCLSRRGHPGDLDRVVELLRAEVDRRVRRGVHDDWIGVARADLATALLERGRFGRFDPRLRDREADADIGTAREMIEAELDRRVKVHGLEHPFVWDIRALLGSALLAVAQRASGFRRHMLGEEVISLSDVLIQHDWQRACGHTMRALRGQLLRAEGLLVLNRMEDAEAEARLASVLAHRYRGHDSGRALLLLARAVAARDRPRALAIAREALTARREWFSAGGHQVEEAAHLVRALSGPAQAGT
jgi:hypothetical protein